MLKFFDSIEVDIFSDTQANLQCGIHSAYAEVVVGEDGEYLIVFDYDVDGMEGGWIYSFDEMENAIWEWLCTLSRATNPSHHRVLGSFDLARVEAA